MIIPNAIPDKAMFKPEEIAELFGVTKSRVYDMIKFGNINAVKVVGRLIRIPRKDVVAFIANEGKGFVNVSKSAVTNRMVATMRGRISHMIRNSKSVKEATSMNLLGCTIDEFMDHIEKQFQPGMTWEN
jgi:excisionase family DNA binding protein